MMIEPLLARYGIWAILVGAGLEGEAVVVTGGVLAGHGFVSLGGAMAAAAAGSCLADQAWFLAGRRLRDRAFVRRIAARPAFALVLARIARHPVPVILGFRFVYGTRTITPVALGASSVPARLFVPLNILAAAIWAALFTLLGWWLGARAMPVLREYGGIAVAIAIVVAAIGALAWLELRRRRG